MKSNISGEAEFVKFFQTKSDITIPRVLVSKPLGAPRSTQPLILPRLMWVPEITGKLIGRK